MNEAKTPQNTAERLHHVLVAEDDPSTRFLIEQYCRDEPVRLEFAQDGIEAMQRLKKAPPDIVVTDVRLPGISGEQLLSFLRETHPQIPVIVITGFGSIDGAVRFLQLGAFDYIAKPFTDRAFTHRLSLATRNLELAHEVDRLRRLGQRPALMSIQSGDPQVTQVLSALPSIAKTEASVVVQGESGTGKELFSRAIHELSRRSAGRFVSVSCAALPETLIESELFGHVRGAFTDAHADRPGLIEEAEGGTLFLDEVGELPPSVQAKLLRFLQEREFKPVGSNEIRHANVRIVSATHRNLKSEVAHDRFRKDLYYRLNVVPIQIPPLRDRIGDIPLLANYFLAQFAQDSRRPSLSLGQDALDRMASYHWPGNVRELMNRIQRMVVMTDDNLIDADTWRRSHVDNAPRDDATNIRRGFKEEKRRVVAAFERQFVEKCLRTTDGNVARAARLAQMDRKNFWMLLQKHDISPDPFRQP